MVGQIGRRRKLIAAASGGAGAGSGSAAAVLGGRRRIGRCRAPRSARGDWHCGPRPCRSAAFGWYSPKPATLIRVGSSPSAHEQGDHAGRACRRQLPVRRKGAAGDRHIVGMTFDADRDSETASGCWRYARQHRSGGARDSSATPLGKQDVGANLDFQPSGHWRARLTSLAVDQRAHRPSAPRRPSCGYRVRRRAPGRRSATASAAARSAALPAPLLRQPGCGIRLTSRRNRAVLRVARRAGSAEGAARPSAEGFIERIGQHPVLALVDRGHRIQDHEQRQQQGHQVAVGDRPGFVVGCVLRGLRRRAMIRLPSVQEARQLDLDVPRVLAVGNRDQAFDDHFLGAHLGDATAALSFEAIGRKNRLALAMP